MTQQVVDRLTAVLARSKGRRNVFMKVGDSITISNHFLKCFNEKNLNLGEHQHLEATRKFFNEVMLGAPKTSFDRASLATHVGWTALDPRRGSPTPLEKEIAGTRPAFAIILFGSNGSSLNGIATFEHDLLADIDYLLEKGIVPLMSTIPPKLNKPESMAAIPEMNAIVRMIAQTRQVPFLDFYQALQQLPDFGLADDGVHPRPFLQRHTARGCWLTEEALQAGMNVRNLLTLTALDRVRRFLLERAPAEPEPPPLAGEGTPQCPFVVDRLPFVDAGDTRVATIAQGATPPARSGNGPEIDYSLHLDKPTRVRARLFVDSPALLHLIWWDEQARSILAEGDQDVELLAPAGSFRLLVDTPLRQGRLQPGTYRLSVVPVD